MAASEAEALVAQISQLYQQLRALPPDDHPTSRRRQAPSPAYVDLEAQIRALAARHWALTRASV